MNAAVNGWNAEYVDAMYAQWRADPGSVDETWQQFFQGFDLGYRPAPARKTGAKAALPDHHVAHLPGGHVAHTKQGMVDSLIYHYRDVGHRCATLDPLGLQTPKREWLELSSFGLTEADLDGPFDPGHLPLENPATLRDIIALLEATYCGHIGVEYMHIQDRERRRWLQTKMEPVRNQTPLTDEHRIRILHQLCEADGFENFLHTRFQGKKRFGLDGGETLIPMLKALAELGPSQGIEEYTLAMAHRGRLNVLVNVLRKSYDQVFTEFDESWTEDFLEGGGDVKYHRGYSGDFTTPEGGVLRMTLSSNPSHLEFANSVVLGRARAKQRLREDRERNRCIPVLIHGDASFPGQGIVAECFNMMKLDGYTVGGAIHFIVNNQVGFTTNPSDAHSGVYCSDLAKSAEAPIFHVNGDDPEACVRATQLALEFRQAFKNDVVIDLWCYRRHGHNEGDEPTFTQPQMYRRIREHPPVVRQYSDELVREGVITKQTADELYDSVREQMDEAQMRTKAKPVEPTVRAFRNVWSGVTEKYNDDPVETGVDRTMLERVGRALGSWPEDFNIHKKIARLLTARRDAVLEDRPLDWAMGELLAYGTLLLEGHAVRLTGQDVERGTFSHRHAIIVDQEDGSSYDPLNELGRGLGQEQAKFCVHNSPLTESACLGFEYGYSLGDPNMLVIWEAQFGDFANGAQVIFDQFIASAEVKWQRYSGLTCFLPHGYEGQGPEHSSARLERFLTLCANDDMQVVYPTTPAQMFHMLRRQMKRNFRKPLIVMTPKSLLRHPKAVSRVDELVKERFHHVIVDPEVEDPKQVRRLLLCTGKIYYDIAAHRRQYGAEGTAIIRIEQLFPFSPEGMAKALEPYTNAKEFVWVQEEPKNMGAYRHIDAVMREELGMTMEYIGRDANASPAVASTKIHQLQQEAIVGLALGEGVDKGSTPAPVMRPAASR